MNRITELGLAALLTTGVALAHESPSDSHGEPLVPEILAPTLFLAGTFVLVTAAVLDHREMLARRQANAGVGLGAVGVLAGIALLFL